MSEFEVGIIVFGGVVLGFVIPFAVHKWRGRKKPSKPAPSSLDSLRFDVDALNSHLRELEAEVRGLVSNVTGPTGALEQIARQNERIDYLIRTKASEVALQNVKNSVSETKEGLNRLNNKQSDTNHALIQRIESLEKSIEQLAIFDIQAIVDQRLRKVEDALVDRTIKKIAPEIQEVFDRRYFVSDKKKSIRAPKPRSRKTKNDSK